jgi:hypothetical protein
MMIGGMNDVTQLLSRVAAEAARSGRTVPPVSPQELERAERLLGFPLHPLLAALYREVADGDFGPEPLLPLVGKDREDEEFAVGSYLGRTAPEIADSWWSWPTGVLPIMDRGCNMFTCLDCLSSEGTVLLFDPNRADGHDLSPAWFVEAASLAEWLGTWLAARDRYDGRAADTVYATALWTDASARLAATRLVSARLHPGTAARPGADRTLRHGASVGVQDEEQETQEA